MTEVTVDWALWGKAKGDSEYHVLRSSDGIFSKDHFEKSFDRYAPGTLDKVPQVTMSWFYDDNQQQFFTVIAIYEQSQKNAHDSRGRDFVLSRCYCAPYDQLAKGRVSYWNMYAEFTKIPIPDNRHDVFTPPLPGPGTDGTSSPLARLTAAMLLTGRPVCILDADDVDYLERLRFLDSVTSLLPYGLRTRLSATTWVNSLFNEHKFRLFFSSASRDGDEKVLWEADDIQTSTGYRNADRYLRWLINDAHNPVARLATLTQPADFSPHDIEDLLKKVSTLPTVQQRGTTVPWRHERRPQKAIEGPSRYEGTPTLPEVPQPPPKLSESVSFEKLLEECDEMMRGRSVSMKKGSINGLAQYHDDQVTAEQRQRYQQIIKERQLFRIDPMLAADLQDTLYNALLRNAFGMPLTYEAYCQVESCAGPRMNWSLLRTIRAGEIPDVVRLLIADALAEEPAPIAGVDDPPAIILAKAFSYLNSHHGHIIYKVALDDLRRRTTLGAEAILYDTSYLAPALRALHRDSPEARLAQLQALLRICYGKALNREHIYRILRSEVPSVDLQYAVTLMTADPEDVKFAQQFFGRKYASWAYPESGTRLLALLPEEYQLADGNTSDLPSAETTVGTRPGRHRLQDGWRNWKRNRKAVKVPQANPLAGANLPANQVPNGGYRRDHDFGKILFIAITIAALCVFLIVVLLHAAAHG
jgi:hypothetical protein